MSFGSRRYAFCGVWLIGDYKVCGLYGAIAYTLLYVDCMTEGRS